MIISESLWPPGFFQKVRPAAWPKAQLILFNRGLADEMALQIPEGSLVDWLSGKQNWFSFEPRAAAYAGHQFGHFVPQLGDGRAVLLWEHQAPGGRSFEIQLKGSGETPFSRRGDGRLVLGPALREFLVSEAMHALGVPTTRSLAVLATGEMVQRESLLPGALLVRVASSHLRVGSFEFYAARGDVESLRLLFFQALRRHDPDLLGVAHSSASLPAAVSSELLLRFFHRVAQRQIRLVSQWLGLGFIHGVMNTDNTSISGETIDYGPCAFMDEFSWQKKFSAIDQQGRYAFGNQEKIIIWNLACLAQALLPLFPEGVEKGATVFNSAIEDCLKLMDQEKKKIFAGKLGFSSGSPDVERLSSDLLEMMERKKADFTETFWSLRTILSESLPPTRTFWQSASLVDWLRRWKSLGPQAAMLEQSNPYLIPRNHWIQAAITQAEEGSFDLFLKLHEAWKKPHHESPESRLFHSGPGEKEKVTRTFCGT